MRETRIAKVYNQYRVNFTDKKGGRVSKYFKSREAARKYVNEHKMIPTPGSVYNKKRRDARDPDLPVGLYQVNTKRIKADGKVVIYHVIATTISREGVIVKRLCSSYGTKRSRKKAIADVLEKRLDWLKDNPVEGFSHI